MNETDKTFTDQEASTLFREHMPLKPVPTDMANRLETKVLEAVAAEKASGSMSTAKLDAQKTVDSTTSESNQIPTQESQQAAPEPEIVNMPPSRLNKLTDFFNRILTGRKNS